MFKREQDSFYLCLAKQKGMFVFQIAEDLGVTQTQMQHDGAILVLGIDLGRQDARRAGELGLLGFHCHSPVLTLQTSSKALYAVPHLSSASKPR